MRKQTETGVYFIAEIGGNHEGDFGLAKDLLWQAIGSGVNAVKFQVYTGDGITNRNIDPKRAAHFDKFTLSTKQHLELAEICKNNQVDYLASVWNEELLGLFVEYMRYIKVGSGDLTNYRFLQLLSKYNKPLILSTGLAELAEVESAVGYLKACFNNTDVAELKHTVLQCTSMYPILDSDAHLNVMNTYRRLFPCFDVGYSDHTNGITAIEVALCMGASMIEAHFTDRSIKSDFRDHLVSKTSQEFRDLISFSKKVKEIKGSDQKTLLDIEKQNGHDKSFRRSLYLKKFKNKGSVVLEGDITVLRPVDGIEANYFDDVK